MTVLDGSISAVADHDLILFIVIMSLLFYISDNTVDIGAYIVFCFSVVAVLVDVVVAFLMIFVMFMVMLLLLLLAPKN